MNQGRTDPMIEQELSYSLSDRGWGYHARLNKDRRRMYIELARMSGDRAAIERIEVDAMAQEATGDQT